MGKSIDDQPESPGGDWRLREFLRRAGPILVAERGWNQHSRLKIKSLADDLMLPPSLYEAAIKRLQSGQIDWKHQLSHYESEFVKTLRTRFRKAKTTVITGLHEKKALQIARREFQLPENRARQLLRQLADEMGLGRVSKADANQHIESLIEQSIGQSTIISDEVRARIIQSGIRWGVDHQRIDSLVDQKLESNRENSKPPSHWSIRFAAALVALVCMGSIAYFAFNIYRDSNYLSFEESKHGQQFNDEDADATARIDLPQGPNWWGEDTKQQFQQLLAKSDIQPSLANQIAANLEAAQADRRQQGFEQLVSRAVVPSSGNQDEFSELLLKIFADENAKGSQLIAESLAATMILPDDRLPGQFLDYEIAYNANDLLQSLFDASTDPAKRSYVNESCIRLLGIAILQDRTHYADLSRTSIANQQWQHLNSISYAQPRRSAQFLDSLSILTEQKLGEHHWLERSTAISILKVNPIAWRTMRQTLGRLVDVADEDQIYELFQVTKSTSDQTLSDWLTKRLANRLGISIERMSTPDIRRSIAQKLDIAPTADNKLASRRNLLWQHGQLEKLFDAQFDGSPQVIANVAHYATLAMMLNRIERNSEFDLLDTFDELAVTEPANVTIRGDTTGSAQGIGSFGRVRRRPLPSDSRMRNEAIAILTDFQSQSSQIRAISLEKLSSVAMRFRDLSPTEAESIAKYLLSITETPEIIALEKYAAKLGNWANLCIALADEIESCDAKLDHILTVANLLLGLEFQPVDDMNLRAELRLAILQRVASGLKRTAEIEGSDTDFQWSQLERALFETYRMRCLSMRINANEVSGAATPYELGRLVLERLALENGMAAEITTKIRTIEYLKSDSLSRFVLINQVLIDLVSRDKQWQMGVGNELDPFRAQIVKGNGLENRNAKSLAEQLLVNEKTLLKLWTGPDLR